MFLDKKILVFTKIVLIYWVQGLWDSLNLKLPCCGIKEITKKHGTAFFLPFHASFLIKQMRDRFCYSIHIWHSAPNPLPAAQELWAGTQESHQRPAALLPDTAFPACSMPPCLRCQIPARGIGKQSPRKLLTLPGAVQHEHYSHGVKASRRSTDVVVPYPTAPSCEQGGSSTQLLSVHTPHTFPSLYQCLIAFQSTWTKIHTCCRQEIRMCWKMSMNEF